MFTKEEIKKQYTDTQTLRNNVIVELGVTQDPVWRANLFALNSLYHQALNSLEIMYFKMTGDNIWES